MNDELIRVDLQNEKIPINYQSLLNAWSGFTANPYFALF